MPTQETELELARRHVIDAQARIARQEAIIAEMVRDNPPAAAGTGRRVIETMRQILANGAAQRPVACAFLERPEANAVNLPKSRREKHAFRGRPTPAPPIPGRGGMQYVCANVRGGSRALTGSEPL